MKGNEEKSKKEKVKLSEKFKLVGEKIKKNKFFSIRNLIILVILIVLLIAIVRIFNTKKVGNTIGNIRNYGYATERGRWVYFLSPNEDDSQMGIFKMKKGDKKQKSKKQIVMDSFDILSLNVNKNYIYFIAISKDAFNENDDVDNKIYKVKTDGSDLKVINDNEFNNDCYEIYVVKDKIYYIGTDENVYKMDLNGGNRELVLDKQTGYLGITDKYIIYNDQNSEQADYITSIATLDGKNQRAIIENTRLYSVNIIGDYVYYTNESKQICRVKLDGTNQEMLYDTTAYNMNVSGDYIYYLNYEDEANSNYTVCIYRVKTNGKTETPEKLKSLETYSSFIDVIDDWIIYMDSSEKEGFINLIKTNGSEEIKVYSISNETLVSDEENVVSDDEEVVEGETNVVDEQAPETDTTNEPTNSVEESNTTSTPTTNEVTSGSGITEATTKTN